MTVRASYKEVTEKHQLIYIVIVLVPEKSQEKQADPPFFKFF